APTGDDDTQEFIIDFGGDDGVSDVVHIDLSTFDEDGLSIRIENYDPTDQITLDGAFNFFVDPGDLDRTTFDYIGEDGSTYSGEVRAKDAGEDDFTTDLPPIIICYAPGTIVRTSVK
ncbi:MAG: hypothetical protein ACU0C9_08240, partial [Paracoccaceae bacterium]